MESARRVRSFEILADRSRLPVEWQKWKRELERYFDACGISSQWEKRSQMLHLAGPDLQEIFDHLPGVEEVPLVVRDPPYYDVAVRKLDEHFEPMRRRNYERHLFRQIEQKPDERFADFVLRLRIQAKRCEFDRFDKRETEDRLIEQIVETCRSKDLRRHILAKDMTLDEIVTLGTTLADVQQQMNELDRSHGEIKHQLDVVNRVIRRPQLSKPKFQSEFRSTNSTKWTNRSCFACGRKGHLKGDNICKAKNAKCLKCGELGHFMNRCLKRTAGSDNATSRTKRIRLIEEVEPENQKEEAIFYAMGKNTFDFVIGGVKIAMVIDSGADANIIEEATWEQAKAAGIKTTGISSVVDRKLMAYATKLPMQINCMFWAEIKAGDNKTLTKFYVVQNGQQNLLGHATAKELKVLKVGFDVASVTERPAIFPKIKGIVVEIPIDRKVQPVRQSYRRAPFALEEKIHDKLEYLLDRDIIEKVNEPSAWVSPVVPILKESGEIRLCVDMRRANQAVLRESHPLPVIEELLAGVDGAVKFSKLDVKDAYHQLEISEDSRVITTFITKYGLFR